MTVRGTVGGDVVTVGGLATLGRRADVSGDLVYFDKKPIVAPGARRSPARRRRSTAASCRTSSAALAIGVWIAFSVSLALFGIILLLLAPRAAEAIARTARARWGMSIGVGIGAFILLPIVAGLICLTVVGTPLGILLFITLIPLYAIAYVSTAFAVGRLILKSSLILAFLLGMRHPVPADARPVPRRRSSGCSR